ncbi:MAG TPA: hypothetical protein PK299_08715, partial [Anaerolineales bacterium]|nr:hypothetical protein [Anaerolineales bacterium]
TRPTQGFAGAEQIASPYFITVANFIWAHSGGWQFLAGRLTALSSGLHQAKNRHKVHPPIVR